MSNTKLLTAARGKGGKPAQAADQTAAATPDEDDEDQTAPAPAEAPADDDDDQDAPAASDGEAEGDDDDEEKPASEARAAERQRIGAILNSAAAKGREATAQHLALGTDMTPAAAVALLETMPTGAAQGGTLSARMAAEPRPVVGANGAGAAPDGLSMATQSYLNSRRTAV
ncbi:MAG: hypothetical protein HQL35_14320 [Alphaproteobacteria bacterium]|nr:hypothetical protein [Alphaproteobacteria bacterium]